MKGTLRSLCCSLLAVSIAFGLMGQAAAQTSLTAGQSKFREIYKELVETDTSVDTGNCTVLADKIEKRLRAAGFTDSEIYRFTPGDFPRGAVSW